MRLALSLCMRLLYVRGPAPFPTSAPRVLRLRFLRARSHREKHAFKPETSKPLNLLDRARLTASQEDAADANTYIILPPLPPQLKAFVKMRRALGARDRQLRTSKTLDPVPFGTQANPRRRRRGHIARRRPGRSPHHHGHLFPNRAVTALRPDERMGNLVENGISHLLCRTQRNDK